GQAMIETLFCLMILFGIIVGIMQICLLATGKMALLLGAQESARSNVVRKDIESGKNAIDPHGFLNVEIREENGKIVIEGEQEFIISPIPFFTSAIGGAPNFITGGIENVNRTSIDVTAECEMPQTPEEATDYYEKSWPDAPIN
ncbi:MAG: TadE family protein, partial [Elusimicrobiota bacterium]